jgi:hypothetical protein
VASIPAASLRRAAGHQFDHGVLSDATCGTVGSTSFTVNGTACS